MFISTLPSSGLGGLCFEASLLEEYPSVPVRKASIFERKYIDMQVWNFQPRSESSQKLLGLEKKDLKRAFPNSLSSPLVCSEVISVYLQKPGASM